ncbi:hypothetical protein D6C95_09758 [Aureobasidium pullulans]|nr:hypothetical protein D6C95_09758 [Aureobasidium pullulans]
MDFKNNSERIDLDPKTRDDNDRIDKTRTEIAETDAHIAQPTSQHQPTAALEVAKEQSTASNTASVDRAPRNETTYEMRVTAHVERRRAANRRKIEEALGRKLDADRGSSFGLESPCTCWDFAVTKELRKELQHKLDTLKSQKETIEQELSAAIS